MGTTTDFTGKFTIDPPLNKKQVAYLIQFAQTRRMSRIEEKLITMEDPLREAVGLPAGQEGEFFVGGLGLYGQDVDSSVRSANLCPSTQPGLWCKWEPSKNGKHIAWNKDEKFYDYAEWISYITKKFLTPWGCSINGDVKWKGASQHNVGVLVMKHSTLDVLMGDDYEKYLAVEKTINLAKKQKRVITSEVATVSSQLPSRPKTKM